LGGLTEEAARAPVDRVSVGRTVAVATAGQTEAVAMAGLVVSGAVVAMALVLAHAAA